MTQHHTSHRYAAASRTSSDDDRDDPVHRISRSSQLDAPSHPEASALVSAAATSAGAPLPGAIMRKFEASLGADLSGVRVHTGAESAAAAASVGARAYAHGQDIHFAAGHYDPASATGEHLLAHEVAHTVQQRSVSAGPQYKLEVSAPGDAHELEADRAADSMVAGAAFALGGGASTSALHRSGETQGDAEPEAVDATWKIDWVNRQTGQTVNDKLTQRVGAGKDAAYGTLKIEPAGGAAQILKWTNAADSGAVVAGTLPHPKDKAGKVSTNIQYGTPPTVSARVGLTLVGDADAKKKPPAIALAGKQQLASTAAQTKLHELLQARGDLDHFAGPIEAAALAALGAAPDGFEYKAEILLSEHREASAATPKSGEAVTYAPFTAAGVRRVTVRTPTEFEKKNGTVAGSGAKETERERTQQDSSSQAHSDSHADTTYTDTKTAFKSSVVNHFKFAWENLKEQADYDHKSISAGVKGKLAGAEKLGLDVKDFTIDVGALGALLAIENPAIALAIKKALGKATVGGNFAVELDGEISGHAEGARTWGKSEYKRELSKFDGDFTSKVEQSVTTQVTTLVENRQSNQSAQATATGKKDVEREKRAWASSADTVTVKVINRPIELEVTSE